MKFDPHVLIRFCGELGLGLTRSDNQIHVRCKRGDLSDVVIEAIKRHKQQLLPALPYRREEGGEP